MPLMTSRGCPFSCLYCHESGEKEKGNLYGDIGRYRLHSAGRVMKELEEQKRLGVQKVFFEIAFLQQRAELKKYSEKQKKWE